MKKGKRLKPARLLAVIIAILCAAGLLLFAALHIGDIAALFHRDAAASAAIGENEVLLAGLDVGQSSCSVLLCGGSTVVIDAGDADASAAIQSFLRARGVSRIDYLVMTHPHADHIGSMEDLITSFEIGELLFVPIQPEHIPTNALYFSLIQTVLNRGVTMRTVTPGERLPLDRGTLEIIAADGTFEELNNCSMVLRYTYGSFSALFMGDAEKKAEEALPAETLLKSDVLFVGHHGSNSSSSEAFLKRVSPRYAVISCGKDNQYGCPARAVLDRLSAAGARVLRTDEDGSVLIFSDGKAIRVVRGQAG